MMSTSGSLEAVVEQLTNFRSEVRAFALARPKTAGLYPERIPLLKACDNLRNDLAPLGVLIKVRWVGSHLVFLHFEYTQVATCNILSLQGVLNCHVFLVVSG